MTPVYLQPGQLYVSAAPARVTTILGSCIAVGLWDDEREIGGINHFMLPHQPASFDPSDRFANFAMPRLIEKLVDAGARETRLRAKVFGGACVLGLSSTPDHLGMKNRHAAIEFLAARRIPVVAEETGGDVGRKLIFHTHDGVALLKRLTRN
ncbi:MAG TPA: chemotaxis protein CheD [Thermoanaerobaculia bacterium]